MSARTIEPERLTIAARRDLLISRRTERGESFYFVEDPLRNKFFRLGDAEHAIFTALDGRRSIAEATTTAAADNAEALTRTEAVRLAEWLVSAGLATGGPGTTLRAAAIAKPTAADIVARWNPWSFRIVLGSPDAWLRPLDSLGRLLFSRTWFVVWLVVVGLGLLELAADWTRIVRGSAIVWNMRGVLLFAVAWVVLKAWHELGHALACRRFGGHVGDVGLAFILGMPSPFVDVSSIRRSPHKWDRIIVSLAGVYFELFVAGAATLVYGASHDPAVRQAALTTAMIAGLSPLLANLNPLMRFDGYYALSDLVELPNLATAGKDAARRVVRGYLFAIDEPAVAGGASQPRWLAWYGLAAGAWRVFISASLVLVTIARFGLPMTALMSLPLVFGWLARRRRHRATAKSQVASGPKNRARQLTTIIGAATAAGALLCCFDPCTHELPAVVDYEPLNVVRAETPGFVRRVFVVGGEQIVAGTVLVELENAELHAELARAELALEQSLVRSRIHRQAGATAKEQAERLQRNVLEAELAELKRRRARLTITAPTAGTIVSRGVEQTVGRWVEKGDEFAAIGGEETIGMRVAVPQRLVAAIGSLDDRNATAFIAGRRESITIRLAACEPTASTRLIHSALSAEHGGATIVRRRNATPEESGAGSTSTERAVTIAESLEPCFKMTVRSTDGADLRDLAAGRTGVVRIRFPWRTVCDDYFGRASAWLHASSGE